MTWPGGVHALVTGGTRGIGRAVAADLAAGGARVLVSGRRRPDDLPAGAEFVAADLSTAAGCASLAAEVLDAFDSRLDVLVDNAGGQAFRPEGALAFTDEEWESDLALNLMAAVRLDRALIPSMRDGGAIVHVSSGAARLPRPASLPYTASKAALTAYSKGLAIEVGGRGVRVNCVMPGFIRTPEGDERLAVRARAAGVEHVEAFVDAASAGIPLGRAGTVAEAAQLVTWLCSPAAGYVSGAQILVDGAAFPAV